MTLAEQAPLVLFVDDLQWADVGSLDLLQYAADRWHETDAPVLLLLSVRSEALFDPGHPHTDATRLRDWLAGLEREVSLIRLTLSPFTENETLKLVKTLAGAEEHGGRGAGEKGGKGSREQGNKGAQEPGGGEAEELHTPQHPVTPAPRHPSSRARFSEWLHTETAGHPFYISETLETLLERELLSLHRLENGERVLDFGVVVDEQGRLDERLRDLLPPGVHRVIRARLDRLPRGAFDLLAAGAVLGATFRFETLARVAGRQPDETLADLDNLLAHRLVVETGERDHPYGFAHDKIRDVVYTEAGDARRRLFHRRALETMQSEGAAPAALAHHALGAGLAEDAIRHSVAAGDDAMALFAVHDAIAHYETARQIADEYPDVRIDQSLRKHLFKRLGRASEIVGDWDRAGQVFHELIELGREAGDEVQTSLAHTRLAFVEAQQRDVERALALLDEAVALAESSGDLRAQAEAN